MNEARILQRLNHPNIIRLYELSDDGTYTNADGSTKRYIFV